MEYLSPQIPEYTHINQEESKKYHQKRKLDDIFLNTYHSSQIMTSAFLTMARNAESAKNTVQL